MIENMYHLTIESNNAKTGKIPVSTSTNKTCPPSCPFKGNGCYAEQGPLKLHWNKVSNGERGEAWEGFLQSIKSLPNGIFWRHNQAGDLAGEGDKIDRRALWELVQDRKSTRLNSSH